MPYVNIAYDNPKHVHLGGCTLDNPYFGVTKNLAHEAALPLGTYCDDK